MLQDEPPQQNKVENFMVNTDTSSLQEQKLKILDSHDEHDFTQIINSSYKEFTGENFSASIRGFRKNVHCRNNQSHQSLEQQSTSITRCSDENNHDNASIPTNI